MRNIWRLEQCCGSTIVLMSIRILIQISVFDADPHADPSHFTYRTSLKMRKKNILLIFTAELEHKVFSFRQCYRLKVALFSIFQCCGAEGAVIKLPAGSVITNYGSRSRFGQQWILLWRLCCAGWLDKIWLKRTSIYVSRNSSKRRQFSKY